MPKTIISNGMPGLHLVLSEMPQLNAPPKDKPLAHRPEDGGQARSQSALPHRALFVLILALGIFARTWEFGRLPPGLNPDEASTGVEALNLLQYGTDRNGISYPVKFISWGSGQDVLYAYLLIPLVAALGLSPAVVRLPMLAFGILSLPLMYMVARQLFTARLALLAMFMLAISPWHILLSRWALDSNLFPTLFLAGFACLLHIRKSGCWFWIACLFFGLCLYSYGTAYAVVPVFLACAIAIVARTRLLAARHLVAGITSFAVLATPIALLLIVNRSALSSISLGPITVPRFPVSVRWETTTLIGAPDTVVSLISNMWTGARLLALESDGILYNVVDPFGYFYRVGLVLALGGLILLVHRSRGNFGFEVLLLLAWIGAASIVAILQAVNINRFNIIFMPLLILGACAVDWIQSQHEAAGPAAAFVLAAAFLAFSVTYHGETYRRQADSKFQNGLLAALRFARGVTDGGLCVTDKINMPYIYVLFTEHTSPDAFQASVKYVDPLQPLQRVASFGRYTFGSRTCSGAEARTYVLRTDEIPPRLGNRYSYEFFDRFVVYYPAR
ncbi:MAG: glycosyltransferase family 39 protein [Chloroflexota bacterium]